MDCPHFGDCGGCYFSIPYKKQLEAKSKTLSNTFDKEVEIIPSAKTEGYRQRMDYVYAFGKLGLRKKGNFREVVDIKRCNLISESMNDMLEKIRHLLVKHHIASHDYLEHKGYLRYVIMREAKFTGQLMVGFVTADKRDYLTPLIEEIKNNCESIVWSVNETMSDTSYGTVYKSWQDSIEENFDSIRLKITANVFFQPNPYVAKYITSIIKEFVFGRTIELYCGIGTIGLYCASRTQSIKGAESVPESIELARENAKINGVEAEFYCMESAKYLNNKVAVDTVIADPPRAGMGRKTCRKILWKKPKRIIIMSCNPKTLHYDLKFLEKKYDVKYLKGFDMFPHTKHIECLCVLDRK